MLTINKTFRYARVVELVDTGDLKSPDLNSRAGSSPAPGTTYSLLINHLRDFIRTFFVRITLCVVSEPTLAL